MTGSQRFLLIVATVFAIAYVATLPLRPYTGDFVIKSVPAICLSALALWVVPGLRGRLLSAALLFCAAGDAALGYEDGENLTIGLGMFLVAQVLFVATFTRDFKFQKSRIPGAFCLITYAVLMAIMLTPWLEDMALPVYVYLTVITIMGLTAAFRYPTSGLVVSGALFFIASDSMLAIEEFHDSFWASDYLVMTTYYLAIFLIVYGMVRAAKRTPPQNQIPTP
jgi:alkenylglycerophosphocholine/alkenylglycerophosphoethanolamine hydrolase